MLPTDNRLQGERTFARIARKGRGIQGIFFNIKILTNSTEHTRLGIVISKKISKKAVVRNKIRRRVREVVRPLTGSLKLGFDVMIVTKPQSTEATFHDIQTDMVSLFRKARLL